MNVIDINSDLGERPQALLDGSEEMLLAKISSANIACGGHAGTRKTMEHVVRLCLKHGVGVGAHPGYPDKENFGRREMDLSLDDIESTVFEQVKRLMDAAKELGASVRHVKPHGALYNSAVENQALAIAIGRGVLRVDKSLILIGLAGSPMLGVWTNLGMRTVGEVFADRRYEPDGRLRHRSHSDALITDPADAAAQVMSFVRHGFIVAADGTRLPLNAHTICVHSDTPNAVAIVAAVRQSLEGEAFQVRSIGG
jgi:UPF0271 protein